MAETKYICHLFMFIFEYKITITLERKICMKISGFQGVPFFDREHLDREELVRSFPLPFARKNKMANVPGCCCVGERQQKSSLRQ